MRLARFITAVMVLAAAMAARGGTIALRSAAKVEAARPVTLADVAELTGDDAVAAGGVVVEDDVAGAAKGRMWSEVTIEQVERALKDAGIPTGRLAVSGSRCYVRFGAVLPDTKGERQVERADEGPREIDFGGEETVRHRVGGMLCKMFGADPASLRAAFDATDEEVLALSTAGRRVAVEPMTSSSSTRALVAVRVYEGESLVVNRSISAMVEVRRRVVAVTKDIQRGRTITADLLTEEERWMAPGGEPLVTSRDQVQECEALTRLEAGRPLREHDAAPAVVIKRGDIVDVLCLAGGLEIKTRARAMSDGRRGERVELRSEGSKKTFVGRADGPSRVVVAMDGEPVSGSAGEGR